MFTEIFSEMLQKKQLKPYHIAKDIGISQGLMSDYKNGVKLPTINNLIKIADYFDVSVDYLLGRTDKPDVNR
jgi:transcriptional regulator with XRE-family HTH domain